MSLSFIILDGVEVLRKRDHADPIEFVDLSSTASTILVAGVSVLEFRPCFS
jgi:hypothetical protein